MQGSGLTSFAEFVKWPYNYAIMFKRANNTRYSDDRYPYTHCDHTV